MLKIKDNVNLKELKKFGFEYTAFSYIQQFQCKNYMITIEIYDDDRKIYIENDYYDNDYACLIPNVIFDLILAGLVEQVEDK